MFHKFLKKNKKGFTLIELIVVIAILGILAAVLLPRFMGFTDDAKKAQVQSDAKNIAIAVEAIAVQGNTFALEDADTTNEVFDEAEIMAYVGKTLGGLLTFTAAYDGSFTYKRYSNDFDYTIEFTSADSTFSSVSKTAHSGGTFAATGTVHR